MSVFAAPATRRAPRRVPVRLSPEATVWFAPPKVDSGVPNRERADGSPILDDIWADESFIGDREFLAVVRRTTRRFEQLGLLTPAGAARNMRDARRSDVGTRNDEALTGP